jgi:GDP-L-fucose synthase
MTDIEPIYSLKGKRDGMVGSALVRRLAQADCTLLTVLRKALDLRRRPTWKHGCKKKNLTLFFSPRQRWAASLLMTGGQPSSSTTNAIATNVIHAAEATDVEKLLFLGSSCIYPKVAPLPITEEALLTGPLEPSNEWYAIAKIAGLKLCQAYRREYGCDFIAAMPTNL